VRLHDDAAPVLEREPVDAADARVEELRLRDAGAERLPAERLERGLDCVGRAEDVADDERNGADLLDAARDELPDRRANGPLPPSSAVSA
jgi:hypothetical protein